MPRVASECNELRVQRRLFFALWPNDALRQSLLAAQAQFEGRGGRAVAAANLHLTLVFLGNVDAAFQACAEAAADAVSLQPFCLQLDRLGGFDAARVAWAGLSAMPPELRSLHQQLEQKLRGCGFTPEAREFQPHITLWRKVRPGAPPALDKALRWQVDAFALVQSQSGRDGVEYGVIRRWDCVGG